MTETKTDISIPDISKDQIDELSYIKPVKLEQGSLFYLQSCDHLSQRFMLRLPNQYLKS